MRTMMRLGLILTFCVALGCSGGNQPASAAKNAQNEEPKKMETVEKTEPAKTEASGMWKVEGDTVTTKSGLKYVIMSEGQGENPKTGDAVIVHTTGWFLDGSKFYSSYDGAGKPLDFPLGANPPRVIAGWEEALPMMKKGAKWQLIVPPALAYGVNGRPPAIPANATLIFDVELLDIKTSGR